MRGRQVLLIEDDGAIRIEDLHRGEVRDRAVGMNHGRDPKDATRILDVVREVRCEAEIDPRRRGEQ